LGSPSASEHARRAVVAVVVGVVVAVAACGPSRAAYQLDVDRVVRTPARAREAPAPATLAPQPWRVGQWTLHRMTSGDELAYERVRIVAQDACGWWIEQVRQSYTERVEVKACYRAPDGTTPGIDLLQQIVVRRDATDPVTLDFRGGQNADTKQQLAAVLADVTFDARSLAGATREDVQVPAGQFRQAARAGDQWFHPAVPLGGLVRAQRPAGEAVLLDYGP